MRVFLNLFICLCLLFTPLPGFAQDNAQPDGAIAVEDDANTDAAIAVRIREILGELERYSDVTVSVTAGIVTLRGQTPDTESASSLTELVSRVEGVVAIENEAIITTSIVEQLNPAVTRFKTRMLQIIRLIPLLLIALTSGLAVLILGVIVARRVKFWRRLAPNAFIAEIYRHAIRIAFAIAGLVIALDIMNATALLGTILGAAGIIGLALGFAVKDTVENFIASVMLSIRQPFRPNDVVEIQGDQGKVIRLTSRATILLSFDGNHIRIPNATVFKSRIVNYSRNTERRFKFTLGLEPGGDLAVARNLIEDTVSDLPYTLEAPAPQVWINEITDGGVTFVVTGWIDQHITSIVQARGDALRLVMAAVETAGYTIPDTTYRIRMEAGAVLDSAITDARAPAAKTSKAPAAPVIPTAQAETITADAEAALDKMINEERREEEDTDLLRSDAELD